jgi:transcription elongation factor Elf1
LEGGWILTKFKNTNNSLYFNEDFHDLVRDRGAIFYEKNLQCPLCGEQMIVKTRINTESENGILRQMIAHGHKCPNYIPNECKSIVKVKSKSRIWIDLN